MTKEYLTRDGRRAIVTGWDETLQPYPAQGLVWDFGEWNPCQWTAEGGYFQTRRQADDLTNFNADEWRPVAQTKLNKALAVLEAVRWVRVTERLPTAEDGDSCGDVEFWSPTGGVSHNRWDLPARATHWRSILTPDCKVWADVNGLLNATAHQPND